MTTSESIKSIRINLGLSQSEFAQLIDIDRTAVSLYESGKRQPSFPTLRRIVEVANSKGLDVKYTDIRAS